MNNHLLVLIDRWGDHHPHGTTLSVMGPTIITEYKNFKHPKHGKLLNTSDNTINAYSPLAHEL